MKVPGVSNEGRSTLRGGFQGCQEEEQWELRQEDMRGTPRGARGPTWMDGREREGNPHRPSRPQDQGSSWALVSLLLKRVWDRK